MPLLKHADYNPAFPFTNGHFQTIYPVLARRRPEIAFESERITTPDGDFIDLDWSRTGSDRVAVISHGLEGNSRRKYVAGAALALNRDGWDTVNLNFRGCSGEPNRLPRLYHSGVTDDLHTVLTHALRRGGYSEAALVGFSMGGNQTLKYLGENPDNVPPQVSRAAVFSVPCDLAGAAKVMGRTVNRVYMEYFLRGLREKVRHKAERFPELGLDLTGLDEIRTFEVYDDRYTAPLHGFASAQDYYAKCASLQFLDEVRVPTLLVNAADDPFLSSLCYPEGRARRNDCLYLDIPAHGGHVGFVSLNGNGEYWSEKRMREFFARLDDGTVQEMR
ncbi:YheT family hydrolase [Desulfovibrio oxyclinae]|uniref:YheT family hydrolase n=1 Tax=Desulfovibrio oxyclinae TaxID=63560 RepID=UPI000399D493|nr:alpha/beta fold hydrolase [Desulfovibrio oxyclinae]